MASAKRKLFNRVDLTSYGAGREIMRRVGFDLDLAAGTKPPSYWHADLVICTDTLNTFLKLSKEEAADEKVSGHQEAMHISPDLTIKYMFALTKNIVASWKQGRKEDKTAEILRDIQTSIANASSAIKEWQTLHPKPARPAEQPNSGANDDPAKGPVS